MENHIWSIQNKVTGEVHKISKSLFKVGRSLAADINSLTNSISRNHATFSVLIDGQLCVQDLQSCNGTYVNNKKILPMEQVLLKEGDEVGFGCNMEILQSHKLDMPMLFTVFKNKSEPEPEPEPKLQSEPEPPPVNKPETKSEPESEPEPKVKNEAEPIPKVENDIEPMPISRAEQLWEDFAMPKAKEEQPSISTNRFSSEPDCVVLSDGEDDCDMYSNSQIFMISEKIKKEGKMVDENNDPYFNIKQELEDLDFCDNLGVVDLTSEETCFQNTCDLLNVLESSSGNTAKPASDTNAVVCSRPTVKYKKPPIIEPHIITKDSKHKNNVKPEPSTSKSGRQTRSPERGTTKRKSSLASPHVRKKSKSDKDLSKMSSEKKVILKEFGRRSKSESSKQKKTSRELKKQIQEERKKKLKEISNHGKSSNDDTGGKTTKHTTKVKVSASRGTFLLEDVSKNQKKPTVPVEAAPSTSKPVTRRQTIHWEDRKIQDKTITTNFKRRSLETRNTRFSTAAPSNTINPDSTCNDASSLIWNSASSLLRNKVRPHHQQRHVSLEEDICRIVYWSVKWLLEQNNMDISPPVNGEVRPQPMPLQFASFRQYAENFIALNMLELWQYVYQSLYSNNQERAPLRIHLKHQRMVGKLTYLDCECYMSDEDLRKNLAPRAEDFALIELKLRDAVNTYIYTGFAYVKFCKWQRVNRATVVDKDVAAFYPGTPEVNLTFSVITKSLGNKEVLGNEVILKIIANIGNSLRLVKSVKYLETSPLCKTVLHPKIEDFQIPPGETDLVVAASLNQEQRRIVLEVSSFCSRNIPKLYFIRGPPGTGKSWVIVNIVIQMLLGGPQANGSKTLILLTAPTNTAVDGLILKLAETRRKLNESQRKHIKMVRLGPESSISRSVDAFKLNSLARNNIIKEQQLCSLTTYKEAMETGADLDKFLREHFGHNYRYQMRCAEDSLLFGSNIVCTTLNSCVGSRILDARRKDRLKFTCCIVDEATQCTEPESLLPVQLGIDKIILVGDPQQLPATVCNKEAHNMGYGRSLFARMDDNFKNAPATPIRMLREQYRMRQEICDYPNKTFYDGQLRSSPNHLNKIVPELVPYLLFNLVTAENEGDAMYTNSQEVGLIYTLLEVLRCRILPTCRYSIGIITPYKAQRQLLLQKISTIKFNANVGITVNTVDSFQGMENDVIFISSVRYNPNYFLQNTQRLNVALTRARQALYVIGNYSLFKHCRPLYDLREDAKRRRLCLDIRDPSLKMDFSKYLFK